MMRREDSLDGRTFEPGPWSTAERRASRPVFGEQDRQRLAADPHLRPYLTITQAQVAGLLCALGRGAGIYPYDPELLAPGAEGGVIDTDALEASRALAVVLRELEYDPRDRVLPHRVLPPRADAVFDAAEQDELSYRKNVRGFERITRQELVRLLRALDEYAIRAPRVEVFPDGTTIIVSRYLHAHNVVVRFRDRPVTLEEFSEEVREVIDKASSLQRARWR